MAKRRTSGRAGKAQDRTPKAKSKKPAAPTAAEVEVVEEAGGEGIDTGIVVMTSVVLLVSCLFVDYLLGTFDKGMFF